MKLATYSKGNASKLGIVIGEDIVDPSHGALNGAPGRGRWRDVAALLQDDCEALNGLKRLAAWVKNSKDRQAMLREMGAILPLAGVRLLAPVPKPGLLLCIGRSYGRHVLEMLGNKAQLPKTPNGFLKSPHCVVGPEDPILLPARNPDMVDFEGEIAIVFGRKCFDVPAEQALDHVAGYTLANEVSARDWNAPHGQPQNWDMVRLGKQFPTFFPMGPVLVTTDEAGDPCDMPITTTVNGGTMQDSTTADLLFTFAEMISYYSRWYEFHPGDVLSTGTPEGVGASRNPPAFLRNGDEVTVSSPALGALTNPVIDATRQS